MKKEDSQQNNKNKIKPLRVRLLIYSSNTNIYAQILSKEGNVLASANSLKVSDKTRDSKAIFVGSKIAKKAKEIKVSYVFLDRNGKKYHGNIKHFADAARDGGLIF